MDVNREKSTTQQEDIDILESIVQQLQKEVDIQKNYVAEYKELNENNQERIRKLQSALSELEAKFDSQRLDLISSQRKIEFLDKIQYKYEVSY